MTFDTIHPVGTPGQDQGTSPDAGAVLDALDDEACRRIMDALRDRHLTAGEISDRCEIPQSTTYRKLELLTEAGLLSSQIRLAPAENNPTEYTTVADGATIQLEPDGEFAVELTHADASAGTATVADD